MENEIEKIKINTEVLNKLIYNSLILSNRNFEKTYNIKILDILKYLTPSYSYRLFVVRQTTLSRDAKIKLIENFVNDEKLLMKTNNSFPQFSMECISLILKNVLIKSDDFINKYFDKMHACNKEYLISKLNKYKLSQEEKEIIEIKLLPYIL